MLSKEELLARIHRALAAKNTESLERSRNQCA